jgi:hypothetical protein
MLVTRKLILSLAFALSASADPLLYVSTAEGKFGTLDPATGAFNQIGPTLSDPLGGLVLGPNGYEGVSFSGNLDSVNPATGRSRSSERRAWEATPFALPCWVGRSMPPISKATCTRSI